MAVWPRGTSPLAEPGGVVRDSKLGADAVGIVRNAHVGIAGERLLPVGASSGRVAGDRAEVAEPFVRTCLRLRAGDLVGDGECRLMMRAGIPECFLSEPGLAEAVARFGLPEGLGDSLVFDLRCYSRSWVYLRVH